MGLISWILGPIIDKRIAAFQSDLMGKHIAEVENIYRIYLPLLFKKNTEDTSWFVCYLKDALPTLRVIQCILRICT